MSHTIAIFPGSFDPFTRGHQALVDDALRIFDKVVIGIGNNVSKAGLLRIEARKQLIEDLYADNPRVEVRACEGQLYAAIITERIARVLNKLY